MNPRAPQGPAIAQGQPEILPRLPVLFPPTALPQLAFPRARQPLSQGHTWG